MDKKQCNSCGKPKCSCKNKKFTKAVIEIDNPEQITLMRRVTIPASMGDDTTVPPVVGKYHNVLLYYEANHKSYLYSSDGIPTLLANGLTDYEQAVNLPEINGHTLLGNQTGPELDLQNTLSVIPDTGIKLENDELSGIPATDTTIGMVKPGAGLEVATDGTMSISDIEQYAHFFDTVADMKAATNLKTDDYARTLGFHTINDGGGALYKITGTGTANEMDVIAVGGLYANLIDDGIINVKQLGAYGNGVNDDTEPVKKALSKANIEVKIPSGTFIVNETLQLGDRVTLSGEDFSSILKCGTDLDGEYLIEIPSTSVHCVIKDLFINGDYKCNGIYDGKTTGARVGIRTHILNVKVYYCNNGLYLNAMGSSVDSCLIYGRYSLTNTGSTHTGIYLAGTDNGVVNTRVAGFTQYGIYCNSSGNRFVNVKSYLNGTGVYLRGVAVSASVLQSEENFHDNFKLEQLYDSNLELTSDEAGIEARNGDTIPTTLNNYAYLNMNYCWNLNIKIAFGTRIMNSETWSCAGKVINMTSCIGVNIDGVCQTLTDSTVQPTMINGDNLVGNRVRINGYEYPNLLKHQTVTLHAASAAILNSQDGDEYNLTIKPASSGGVALLWFSYDDNWTTMCIFNRMSAGAKITNIFFRYTVSGQNYSFDLSPITNKFTSDLSMTTLRANMADLLANNETYQEFISQGATITDKMIFINSNLDTSAISSRENIKGLLEVYTNY